MQIRPEILAQITDRLLNIPDVVASRYERPGTLRHKELASEGYLALTKALHSYDPSFGAALPTWVMKQVEFRILRTVSTPSGTRHEKRWRSLASLDHLIDNGVAGVLNDSITEPDREWHEFEAAEFIEAVLKCLFPTEREMYVLRYRDGLQVKQIAARYGLCSSTVGTKLHRIQRRIAARVAELLGSVDETPSGNKINPLQRQRR